VLNKPSHNSDLVYLINELIMDIKLGLINNKTYSYKLYSTQLMILNTAHINSG
jgi:hypothetical protein